MLKSKKLFLIAFMWACVVGSLVAQSDSPYGRYGYGMLRDQAVGVSKGMGGIAYGMRSSRAANPLNPASYSKVDSLSFLFDIGVTYNSNKLSDATYSYRKQGGGLDYMTVLVPLKKNLGLSFGVLPYSSVGYKYENKKTAGTTVNYTEAFSGTGGFSQVYAGLGYSIPSVEGLSVGANASFLFGTIEHVRSIPQFTSTGTTTAYSSYDYSYLKKKALKFDFGLQYEYPVSTTDVLTLGATYSPNLRSKANYEHFHHEVNSSGIEVDGDTTLHKGVDAGLPSTYGLGFTYNKNDRLLIGADITFQKWSDVKYTSYMQDGLNNSNRFNDRWKFNAGVEYMVNPYERSYFKRIKFRGGASYSNSYLNAQNKEGKVDGYNEYGATVGLGLPFYNDFTRRTSYVNLSFEYKKLKPKVHNMVSEEYFAVSMNINISEFWFFRRKVD